MKQYTTFAGVPAEKIGAELARPLAPQAYKGVPGGADLTDINTGHMIERVIQVFGTKGLGWGFDFDPLDVFEVNPGEKRLAVNLKKAVFWYILVTEDGTERRCEVSTGGYNANNAEYAHEGARTSALGAALKGLGFQLPVYKGELDHHNAKALIGGGNGNGGKPAPAAPKQAAPAASAPAVDNSIEEIDAPPAKKNGNGNGGIYVIAEGATPKAEHVGKQLSELSPAAVKYYATFTAQTPAQKVLQAEAKKFLESAVPA